MCFGIFRKRRGKICDRNVFLACAKLPNSLIGIRKIGDAEFVHYLLPFGAIGNDLRARRQGHDSKFSAVRLHFIAQQVKTALRSLSTRTALLRLMVGA